MWVKPGDELFWDEDWEATHESPYDILDDIPSDAGPVTIYRATVVQPETYVFNEEKLEWEVQDENSEKIRAA